VAVSLGFRRKRSLFSGGPTDESRPVLYWLLERRGIWPRFPRANVYHRENDVFELLGVPKRREAPLELLLPFFPYYFTFAFVLVAVWSFQESIWGGALYLLFIGVAVHSMLQPRRKIWACRSKDGNV
jgi:hypothetical protein